MKNSLDGLNRRLKMAEVVCKFEKKYRNYPIFKTNRKGLK